MEILNYKHTNCNVNFYSPRTIVEDYNIDLYNERNLLPSIVKLADDWKVEYNVLIDWIIDNEKTNELFDFSIIKSDNNKLVCEKGIYTEKYVREKDQFVKTYYDVYIKQNVYITLLLPKIVEYILTEFYPQFALFTYEPKFKKEIKITPQTTIRDIDSKYCDCHLTAQDILSFLTKPHYDKTQIKKLAYNIYNDGDIIFYPLQPIEVHGHTYERSLYIPREAIINNDWSIVEKQRVYSIIKPDANELLGEDKNNWYEGEQKNAPYFCDADVKIVKELFKVLD